MKLLAKIRAKQIEKLLCGVLCAGMLAVPGSAWAANLYGTADGNGQLIMICIPKPTVR